MNLYEFLWTYSFHKTSLVSRKSLKKVSAHEPMWVLTSLCELLWAYMSSYEPMCFIRWALWARRVSKKWAQMSLCELLMSLCDFISLCEFSWACVSWYRILAELGPKLAEFWLVERSGNSREFALRTNQKRCFMLSSLKTGLDTPGIMNNPTGHMTSYHPVMWILIGWEIRVFRGIHPIRTNQKRCFRSRDRDRPENQSETLFLCHVVVCFGPRPDCFGPLF